MEQDSELRLLSNVHSALKSNSELNQRELAQNTNLSLGMTNALLRRFADKGWLYMKKISKRNIRYVLTSEGIKELASRSKRYFKNTARLMSEYKNCISHFAAEAVNAGCNQIVLIGESDLEFLFDYACGLYKLSFYKKAAFNSSTALQDICTANTVVVFSDEEQYEHTQKTLTLSFDNNIRFTSIMHILREKEIV